MRRPASLIHDFEMSDPEVNKLLFARLESLLLVSSHTIEAPSEPASQARNPPAAASFSARSLRSSVNVDLLVPVWDGPPNPPRPRTNYLVDHYLICASVPSRMFEFRIRFAKPRTGGIGPRARALPPKKIRLRTGPCGDYLLDERTVRLFETVPIRAGAEAKSPNSRDGSCFTAT
jgi:hypothetical protein